jgi:hypothetical protein
MEEWSALVADQARSWLIETSSRADYTPPGRSTSGAAMTSAARVPDFYAPGDDRVIFARPFITLYPREPRPCPAGRIP